MYIDLRRQIVSESTLQIAVIEYTRAMSKLYPDSSIDDVFHVPNGGRRPVSQGSKLKLEGVKRGVSDLIWLVPNDEYLGLIIELKWGAGQTTIEQDRFLEKQINRGYACYVLNNIVDCMLHINKYFNLGGDDEFIRRHKEHQKINKK